MRENRLSGSEGGGAEPNRLSLPLSKFKYLRDRDLVSREEYRMSNFEPQKF